MDRALDAASAASARRRRRRQVWGQARRRGRERGRVALRRAARRLWLRIAPGQLARAGTELDASAANCRNNRHRSRHCGRRVRHALSRLRHDRPKPVHS
eukprot:6210804-Pleurochrysis_carterae.AAC.1